jgi:hypothetical protein
MSYTHDSQCVRWRGSQVGNCRALQNAVIKPLIPDRSHKMCNNTDADINQEYTIGHVRIHMGLHGSRSRLEGPACMGAR